MSQWRLRTGFALKQPGQKLRDFAVLHLEPEQGFAAEQNYYERERRDI